MNIQEELQSAFNRARKATGELYGDAKTGVKNYIEDWKKHIAEVRESQERFQNGMQDHCDMFGIDETEEALDNVSQGRKTISEIEDRVSEAKRARVPRKRPPNPFDC